MVWVSHGQHRSCTAESPVVDCGGLWTFSGTKMEGGLSRIIVAGEL